jgi:2-oxoglutarate ferredoxin oxidoreductase subunit alpha
MREKIEIPAKETIKIINRKKPKTSPESYMPYHADEDGIPPMANFGEGYRYYITGTMHNAKGVSVAGDPAVSASLIRRLHEKLEKNMDDIVRYESHGTDDAEIVVLAYGCVARSAMQAVKETRSMGVKSGLFRPITLWPYPEKAFLKACDRAHTVIIPEMNIGQYAGETERILYEASVNPKIKKISGLGCEMIYPAEIKKAILEASGDE